MYLKSFHCHIGLFYSVYETQNIIVNENTMFFLWNLRLLITVFKLRG